MTDGKDALTRDNGSVRQTLYKYFSDLKWAEAFLDGEVRFRSLAYFRDYEDAGVRGDRAEGTATFRPDNGLDITNRTQGTSLTLRGWAFESSAKHEEIFAFCTSRALTEEMRSRFNANACVEIPKIQSFGSRIRNALPASATVRWGRVEYYDENEPGSPRWALPDMIALSKLKSYEWQQEYRFIFCLTDALDFEKSTQRLVKGQPSAQQAIEHRDYLLKTKSLRDICSLHGL